MSHKAEYPTGKELCDALGGKWVPTQRRGKAKCPAHEDENPSLDIEEKGGRTLVICRAGCSQGAVLESLRAKGHWPERGRNGGGNGKAGGARTIVAVYTYQLEDGTEHYQVVRYGPQKEFLQRRPDENGGYIYKRPLMRYRIPYRLPEVQEAIANDTVVFLLEGEKDVENGRARLGIVATCNAGGAGKWTEEHAAYLKGANAVIVPDNDDPGREHAERVANSLVGIAKRVCIVTLPGLQEKGDLSDWIEAGGMAEQLWALVEQAPDWQPSGARQQARPRSTQTAEDDPPHWGVEPAPEPADGAALLDDITSTIRRYMVLRPHAAEAIAMWVMHSWTVDATDWSPLLILVSPTKQCGKTTLLTLLYWITPRSELMSGASASSIFRAIEDHRPRVPTLLLDEADAYIKGDEDMRGMLNSGHMRQAAWVRRTESEGKKFRSRRFSTWAPKVIATIKAIADTLMDRGIIITLRRKTKAEKVERFRMRDRADLAELRSRCLRWAQDHANNLKDADPDMPAELDNRPADNWRFVVAIAHAAGGEWPKRARDAALALLGFSGQEDRSIDLLGDIRRVFDERTEWLGAERLVERLVELPETPWAEWRTGDKPITSRGVARMLKDFGIQSHDERDCRKYYRTDFEEAWASYL